MASLDAECLDIGAGGLGDAQPVESQQRDQRMLGRRPQPGRDQQRAELIAVQAGGVRLVVLARPADVRGRGMVKELFLHGVLVEPGDGAQPPGDGGAGAALGLQLASEGLDVGPKDREQRQGPCPAPAGELPKVEGVSESALGSRPGTRRAQAARHQ